MACSLVASRLDYCNTVLHSTPESVIAELQWGRITLQSLHDAQLSHGSQTPVTSTALATCEATNPAKLTVMVYKTLMTASPAYLSMTVCAHYECHLCHY